MSLCKGLCVQQSRPPIHPNENGMKCQGRQALFPSCELSIKVVVVDNHNDDDNDDDELNDHH